MDDVELLIEEFKSCLDEGFMYVNITDKIKLVNIYEETEDSIIFVFNFYGVTVEATFSISSNICIYLEIINDRFLSSSFQDFLDYLDEFIVEAIREFNYRKELQELI